MVGDFEWSEWSDREISRRCHVSHIFVAKVRSSIDKADEVIEKAQESSSDEVGRKYVDKHGNVSTMKTASKKKEAVKEEEPQPEPSVPAAEADKLQETIEFLIKENEALTDKLAAGSSDDPEFTARTIEELRDENKQLRIEVKSLTISRDQFQAENAQLMKQVNYLTKKLKKFES
jgi:FtsZ-binding cell division protein ZapB